MFILFSCSSGVLFADDFNQFLNKAIEASPYLQSSAIGVEQAKQESYKQLRYENPTLSGEFLKYKPNDVLMIVVIILALPNHLDYGAYQVIKSVFHKQL